MKLGLVVEGGGMKCAYTAAILDRFLDDQVRFDYIIGVSAGATCAASYAAGQRGRNRRFFVDHVTEPDYMGASAFLRSGQFFNLQYIYGELTEEGGGDPLDYQALMANPASLLAVATDRETGRPVYFSKEMAAPHDYRIYMATCAIPVVSKPIEINGRYYYDGGCSDTLPVRKALDDGCDKVVVLLCRPKDTVREPEKHKKIYHRVLRNYPCLVHELDTRYIRYNKCLESTRKLEEKGRALIIAPDSKLDITTYTKNPQELQGLYDIGLREYEAKRKKILDFVGCGYCENKSSI
ncbi:MAG: patatin family protein [Eubacterium sp.]|nr:patatin family protein [Eubacterium sp.]